ncbi:hypothetical protein F3Y22_tig00116951pilonHSYRG00841 [Hibiscus syriacus]|uniref:WPP domain-containing protein n=1 Tax=Hibiscus syriacus TaxID=106335 RepID=A0A6A2X174_HIBSY|nr:hypothetical protein F3Y22_tig00116951pilonHSYRG00841 [Hibiscus syriacus]
MTKKLTTSSIFSRKRGLLSNEEAVEDAKKIEELALAAADEDYKNPDGDGGSAVQIHAKESSRLMLEESQLNEVDMSTNAIRQAGAGHLAQVVVTKPGFMLLNINGNFIPDEGIDKVKKLFRSSPEMLGPLDKNDPERKYDDEDEEDSAENEMGHTIWKKGKSLSIITFEDLFEELLQEDIIDETDLYIDVHKRYNAIRVLYYRILSNMKQTFRGYELLLSSLLHRLHGRLPNVD